MMCKKCKMEIPDGASFCPWCGANQTEAPRKRHKRGNGQGTAIKRGNTWTARVVMGYTMVPGDTPKHRAIYRTRGGFRTKREALEFCAVLRGDDYAGPHAAPPLNTYWETYSGGKMQALSASKQTAYRGAWAKLEVLHWRAVDRIGVSDLQATVAAVAPSYYTARDCKTVLTRLFEMAAAEGWCSKDLPSFIELPKLEEKERQVFTDLEQSALWRLYEAGDLRAAIPLLMIATGMMPGEMQRLKVENIDIDGQKITGVGLKTKIRKESPVYLPADILPVVEDLIAHAQRSGYLWKRVEEAWYADYYAALEAAGCRRLEPYCCRHTTATRLAITEGVAPQTVRRMMRWSTARMLDRYAHPDDKDAIAAANRMTRINITPNSAPVGNKLVSNSPKTPI